MSLQGELTCPVCCLRGINRDMHPSSEPGVCCPACGVLIHVGASVLDYHDGQGQNPPDKHKMVWRQRNAARRLAIINAFRTTQSALVDIGCGSGEMLLAARDKSTLNGAHYYDKCIGFEVNQPLVNFARAHYHLRVMGESFSFGNLPEEFAKASKVFTLSHVLEHVSDPAALLAEIRVACSEQDLLYVEVPLYTGESFRKQRYNWNLWNHEHLVLYSNNALEKLLNRCGFSVLTLGTRIFARGSHSMKTRMRLLRQYPRASLHALLYKPAYLSLADVLIADYGFALAIKN